MMSKKETHDPVCGMDVSIFDDATTQEHKNTKYLFCSDWCANRFRSEPAKFLKEPIIRLHNIWKVFRMGNTETQVLRGMNINIWKGDFVAIVGASGSGKSTALNIMGLLDRPTEGNLFLNGKDMSFSDDEHRTEFRRKLFGFVFQQYNLISWLTAYENVGLPLVFSGNKENLVTLNDKFKTLGMEHRMSHRPTELSGGEQQRTALLRALVNDPDIILGDEPTGNLDSKTGEKILNILIDLNKKKGKTLVIVTHDRDIADMADQVITLKDGHLVRDDKKHKSVYTE